MLWRKLGSKLILNTPKINYKNQKIELAILLDLEHHSTKQYPQMLQKLFFNRSTDIFKRLHKIFNKKTLKVSCSCMQYYIHTVSPTDIVWLLSNRRMSHERGMPLLLHQSHEKSTLGLQIKNERKGIMIIKSHSITNEIHMRRHFQVVCGIWRKLKMKLLTWDG